MKYNFVLDEEALRPVWKNIFTQKLGDGQKNYFVI